LEAKDGISVENIFTLDKLLPCDISSLCNPIHPAAFLLRKTFGVAKQDEDWSDAQDRQQYLGSVEMNRGFRSDPR
jgi:hypothetical protein